MADSRTVRSLTLNIVEKLANVKIKRKIKQNRVGDHIWYVSSMKKFRKTIQTGSRSTHLQK